ncbi:hypothetical protein ASV35_19525 [Enterobacter hormaechei subsp. steigerwaltii]|uniref:DUF551 domain-containing protein n=2 Tax=Enterobacter hormaechei TaxID=158836 RepID=UPI0007357545|nr:DUF551 domain-containing protein [Enterobacter hormaechei]KTG91552.1 hypothetical protein ASV35_19525 [Enterobacter hormaechei subsp. steigerwaltii]KVJ78448.1 hypothetical protein AWS26_18675 [Enterobacter hormaechei subsp. steigerwaltii]MCU3533633.1 DUF551 domain-containing protein [Enterobacter hormaechei subsp. steigerwaltii]MDX7027824.1 DUF551 domain-containing protein [Enterobacter hormaechei]
MQNEIIFYMDKAVDLFNSLREEKVSERIDNAHLGAMGAVNVQVWTSVLGGTLQYETSNGGCTLRVIHTYPALEENIQDGWVACSERMPEREIDVQVYCSDKKEQMVGYMERNERDGYFRFASLPNGGGVYCQPTHWMPLPEAPRQEDK